MKNEIIITKNERVVFGDGSLQDFSNFLLEIDPSSIFILTDENTNEHCFKYLSEKVPQLSEIEVFQIASGEASKSIPTAFGLWEILTEKGADRQSLLINLGGGMITDLGGFVASTFKRGIRFVNISTSLLGMIDASIGGKTGINLHDLKNQIGSFSYSQSTFIDPNFLKTLPNRELISGVAEMLKHSIIDSEKHFYSLAEVLRDDADINSFISKSIKVKSKIVEQDPLEKGARKKLNFGHTIGHAFESWSLANDETPLLHGEAIAMGMLCEIFISTGENYGLSKEKMDILSATILNTFPYYPFSVDKIAELIKYMNFDKKNSNGEICFSLLKDIGNCKTDCYPTEEEIISALFYYCSISGL